MAGNQLRMNPEMMRQRANEVRTQGENVDMAINYLRRLIVDTLPVEQEGTASAVFSNQFLRLEPAFREMRELVAQIGYQLDQTAHATESLDAEIASMFNV